MPHFSNMTEAAKDLVKRKFGEGGPFNKATKGPWKESSKVRSAAKFHKPDFQECVATMAQSIFNRFGKFPGTRPSVFCLTYLQAHHPDLDFYNEFFKERSYLYTHANNGRTWWK